MENGNPNPFSLGPFQPLSSASGRVYLDHNATTPPADIVGHKLTEWLGSWGNPSSIHWSGRGPKALLRESRARVAAFLGCDPLEIIFTSSGSEANNLALFGAFRALVQSRPEVIVSAIEHPSVMKCAFGLKDLGAKIHVVPVDRSGTLDLNKFENLLSERTALVSVMAANNETGNLMPLGKIVSLAHRVGALVHTDAVQALGKMPISLKSWGVDLASFSAHKYHALKGAGVLFARRGLRLESLIKGGGQERGRRAGTENLLAIAALGEVLAATTDVQLNWERLKRLRDHLEKMVQQKIAGVRLTGSESPRLPNTSSLVIENVDGETLLMNLDMKGYSVSTGAACSSGNPEPSPVLLAMGLSRQEAQGSLRLSVGLGNTQDEIDGFVDVLHEVVTRLRSFRHGEQALLGIEV